MKQNQKEGESEMGDDASESISAANAKIFLEAQKYLYIFERKCLIFNLQAIKFC